MLSEREPGLVALYSRSGAFQLGCFDLSCVDAWQVQDNLRAITVCITTKFPKASVHLFGSQATGLALPGSDLDVVVLGLSDELASPASGFT